jgi:hypothetical protein
MLHICNIFVASFEPVFPLNKVNISQKTAASLRYKPDALEKYRPAVSLF